MEVLRLGRVVLMVHKCSQWVPTASPDMTVVTTKRLDQGYERNGLISLLVDLEIAQGCTA
jgi:hypothetical protein